MAAPGKPSASRWGSFLTSAVAGVESRLDNMLSEGAAGADDDDGDGWTSSPAPKKKPQPQPQPQSQAPMTATAAAAAKSANTRSSSKPRGNPNDRLQARLAKAMAAKSGQGNSASPRSSFDSRPSMDRPSIDRPSTERPSIDSTHNGENEPAAKTDTPPEEAATQAAPAAAEKGDSPAPPGQDVSAGPKSESPQPAAPDEKKDAADDGDAATRPTVAAATTAAPQSHISELAKDMDEIKARQQEEIQEYVERIDSLQSKLKYLSRNAADAAKKAASAAPPGSAERKLAEKDEKIALLMEEGQKLSSSEQTFRATVKRLRLQMADKDKQVEDLRRAKDKAASEADALRSRLEGDEEKEKRQEEARKATASLQREIDGLKKERAVRDDAMRRLEQDLRAKADKAAAASADAHAKAVAAEKARQRELEDKVAALEAERDSLRDKARLEGLEWTERLARATERGRTVEADLRAEVKVMEGKLEAMRSVAEEASSGSGGEAQVKLLRQIETLQSQYATASDNWQGIEASLLAKVASLEKEKDEAQRRDRCRGLEDELQDVKPELETARRELETCREQLAALRMSAKTTETALEQARADLDKMQRAAAREMQQQNDAYRRGGWADDVPAMPSPRNQSRPDSPLLSVPRNFSSELAGLQIFNKPLSRRTPVSGSIPDSPGDLGSIRRLPSQPSLRRTGTFSTTGSGAAAGSGVPPMPFSPFEPPPSDGLDLMSPPSLAERDESAAAGAGAAGAGEGPVPFSPRNVAQDMVSVSTVGAGPSVQLVERMSAAIRRLEAEKVAAKEEMARVCSQRDEARSDILSLMRDVEAAKAASRKADDAQRQLEEVNARYQTTLELLGEKSEMVEELKADVQDVKEMYRELVERTVK
ncbi:TATA element modulatory factor 1 DNA binding [Geosmithia morbida]|uniref:TATA element modulatory factor 1 DNA binding n=1 Tax=Geosmithia morbida TaxID=1094350 RepID=A0A9P4YUG8_9HYPO|nr:TATA element modulatory factor 1 DNA binding [Geosmithia morbida]KAF4123321.1 TATA element modulatory factor 1 DNA binding [Geosmithia morbida]